LQDAIEDVERLETRLAKEVADLNFHIPLSTPQRVAEVRLLLKRAKREVKRMEQREIGQ